MTQSAPTPAPLSDAQLASMRKRLDSTARDHWYAADLSELLTEVERLRALVPSGLTPTRYDIDGSEIRILSDGHCVEIAERCQRDGARRWAVCDMGLVLSRYGDWEREPIPSSRTNAFIERTRFNSVAEALAAYRASVELDAARTEGGRNAR